jgi:hypothetical protein
MYQVLGRWFQQIPGFAGQQIPGFAGQQFAGQQFAGQQIPGFAGQQFAGQQFAGQQIPGFAGQQQAYGGLPPLRSYQQGIGPQMPGIVALRPAVGDTAYDIPNPSAKLIQNYFASFRDLIPRQSSPALERANTLASLENRDRTFQTGVCRDQYWTAANLATIYPWSTFQLLSTKDWSQLAGDRTNIKFEPEWSDFLNKLGRTYTAAPKLERPSNTEFLDQMKFTNIGNIGICKLNQNPRVRFQEVQGGLLEMQGRYGRHVKEIWNILNDLIFIVEDPDTKAQVVRLHPNVVNSSSKISSQDYVKQKSAAARALLRDFYSDIEDIYMGAVKNLQEV